MVLVVTLGLYGSLCSEAGVHAGNAVVVVEEQGSFGIPYPKTAVAYLWGLPLLTTKKGRRVTLTRIRLLHAPPEVRDVSFVRIRYSDLGTGIGIIETPTPRSPEPKYRPLPVLGVTYDDVHDDQLVLQFSLSKPVVADLSDIEIVYQEKGRTSRQVIRTLLRIAHDPGDKRGELRS